MTQDSMVADAPVTDTRDATEVHEHDTFEPGAQLEAPAARTSRSEAKLRGALEKLGWEFNPPAPYTPRRTREAVTEFQRGHAFWKLAVDGVAGPKTWEALEHSLRHGGRTSAHFRFSEFKSRGDGWIRLHRALVLGLEEYRDLVGHGVTVINGYRDPIYNKTAGGASMSQHLFGCAADIKPEVTTAKVAALRRFSGIGTVRASGEVAHVDVRHVDNNTTRGTATDPTLWLYY